MKKETQKKSKLWLWILLAVLALAIIGGVVAAFVLPGLFQQQGPSGPTAEAKLYWNLDRLSWIEEETNMSAREKAEDGYFYIRYAFDGKVEELKITDDKRLVNYLDTQDLVCLAFDENGVVVDCVPASTYFTPAAKDLYTKRVQNNMLQLNSSIAMNGMDMEFDISNIPVYEVAEGSENKGELITPQWLDVCTVYNDLEGNPYAAYVTGHLAIDAEVAWRVESSMYSASTGYKRTPDKNGVYTIPFAINGEIVNRYCRDYDMCVSIESQSMYTAYFALEYDEEGYIIDWEYPNMALQGALLCSAFNVDSVQDGNVTATRYMSGNNQGEQVQFAYDENTEIYQCCIGGCYKKHCGERIDSLKEGDLISVFTDLDGKAVLIYVAIRTVDTPVYYNLNQQWSWTNNETLRVPDEDGYYVFEMAVNGGVKTVRTKNKAFADQIDGNHSFACGLELSGSVIKKVLGIPCVSGRAVAFGGRFVTSYNRPIISVASTSDITNVANWIMRSDCKIYNVEDNYGVKLGTKTDMKVGDKVLGLMDARGELNYIFVQQKTRNGYKVGYNMARKYSTVIGGTTRVPNEEGYYVYDIAYDGKVTQLKTKNKAMADFIDFQNAPVLGFKEKNGIFTDVCTAASAIPYGLKQYNYNNIENMNGGILTSWYMSNGVKTLGTAQWRITSKTKTYNVSKGYEDHPGEKSKPKVGDKIQALVNTATGEIQYIFIMNRPVDSPIYWMVSRVAPKYVNGELVGSNRVPDEDGYYVIDLLLDGKIKQYKTKDEMIAAEVDTYTQGLGLKLKEGTNIIERVVAIGDTLYPATAIGNADVKKISGNTITTERCRLTSSNYGEVLTNKLTKKTKIYDVSSYAKNWGAATKLSIGDRIVAYTDLEGNIAYVFITKAAARDKGVWGYCDHCGKKVYWDSYSEIFSANGHYYLPADMTVTSAITFGSSVDDAVYDQVFDLNGHTLKSTTNVFTVRDKLTIIDSVGTGKVSNGKGLSFNGSKQGGNIFVAEGGTFTLLSGAIENGAVGLTGIGSNISAYNGTVNIKGGKISGGVGYLGTAVYHSGTKGGINISGGKLGGNVYAEESNKITLSGAPTIEKLVVAPGNKIKLGDLKKGASITVKGDGIFTTESNNINALKAYFKPANSLDTITVSGKALKYNNISGEQVIPEPENPNKPLELDKNGMGTCALCGEKVQWTALHEGDVIGDMNPVHPEYNAELFGGDQHQFHYYVAEDMTAGDGDFLFGWQGNAVCLHLNGKTLNVRGGFYGGNGATINIYGEGKVHYLSNATTSYTAGNMFEAYTSNINIYGGEFTTATNMIHGAGSALQLSISDDAIINGNVKLDYGNATISGNVYVKRIAIGETAKLSITRLFKGETSLSVAAGLEEGNLIPEANVAVLGNFTGKLTYSDFRSIIYKNGRLKVVGEAPSPNDPLDLDANNMGICYVCGENVQWIALHAGNRIGDVHSDGQTVHYYVAEDMSAGEGDFQFIRDKSENVAAKATATVCLHLNGKLLNVKGVIEGGHGANVNIMGDGKVTNSGNKELLQLYTANMTLYGGEYYSSDYPVCKSLGEYAKLTVQGDAKLYGNVELPVGSLIMKESARVDNVALGNTVSQKDIDGDGTSDNVTTYGKVTVGANWAGMAKLTVDAANMDGKTIKAESGVALGNFTGTLINQDGKKFINNEGLLQLTNKTGSIPAAPAAPEAPAAPTPPIPAGINDNLVLDSENKATCVHCGEEVVWTPIANGEKIGMPATSGATGHYYLTEDNTSAGLFFTSNNDTGSSKICLHLNGHNLTSAQGFTLQNNNKVTIMGNGTVSANDGLLFEIYTCEVNLYGGTYSADAIMECLGSATAVSVRGDVQLNGTVRLKNGRTYFAHNVSADKVEVSATGKLQLANNWKGTFEISVADSLMDGKFVKASAVEILGAVDGTITNANGVVTVQNKRLHIDMPEPETPVWGVFNPEACDNKAYCPVCGEAAGIKTWTKISSASEMPGYKDNSASGANGTMEHLHYYLSKDINYNNGSQFIGLNQIGACLHLNGHKLTTSSRLFITGAGYGLNIIAGDNGGIDYTGAYHAGGVINSTAALNLVGGTYTSIQTEGTILPIIKVTGPATLTDAIVNGFADVQNTITVKGKTTLDNMVLSGSGKLVIADGWEGDILLSISSDDIVDGKIKSSRAVVEGNFTGTITLADGRTAVKDGNQLKVEGTLPDMNDNLVLDENHKGRCLRCNQEVTWTPIGKDEKINKPTTAEGQLHYYLTDDTTTSGTFFTSDNATGSNVICLHLNGHNLTTGGGFVVQNGNALNLMGNGTVTHSGTNGWMFEIWTCTLNIYGGTYNSNAGTFAIKSGNSNVTVSGNATLNCAVAMANGNLKVGGNATFAAVDVTGGKLTIGEGWAGTMKLSVPAADITNDLISTARVALEGDFTGTITMADGKTAIKEGNQLKITAGGTTPPVTPTEPVWGTFDPWNYDGKAYCEHCGEAAGPQTWTAISGSDRIGALDNGNHYHVYLSGNVEVDKGLTQTLSMSNGTSVCLNLNGKEFINHGRMLATGSGTLAIMGDGNVSFAADSTTDNADFKQALICWSKGGVYIYGGTYSVTGAALSAGMPTISATVNVYIKDATVKGFVEAKNSAVINLEKSAVVDDIRYTTTTADYTGKVVVAADWTGAAKLTLPDGLLTDGVVATANGAALGNFTGALSLPNGMKLVNDNGSLKVDDSDPIWGVFEPWKYGGRAYCEACGEKAGVKTWEVYNGEYGDNLLTDTSGVLHFHYYLDKDHNYTTANFLNTYENICLHLNGHKITAAGTNSSVPISCTQQLCVMGEGIVTGSATSSADVGSVFQINGGNASATLKVYGGTYKKPANSTNPLVSVGENGGRVYIYGGTFDVNGSSPAGERGNLIYAQGKGATKALVEIHGGTFVGDSRIGSIKTDTAVDAMASLKVLGGSYDGKISVTNACELTLGGAAEVKEISVAADSKLIVKSDFFGESDFTGEAALSFEAPLVENKVPAANAVVEGGFTGFLSLVDGTPLVADGAILKVPAYAAYMKDLEFAPGTQTAYCALCDASVQWTDLNAKSDKRIGYNSNKGHLHFYLSDDLVATETAQFAELEGNTILCFHLNGHDLVTSSRFIVSNGTANILGRGKVTFEGDCVHNSAATYNSVGFEVSTGGTLNICGGSYATAGAAQTAGKPMMKVSTASSELNLFDVAVSGGVMVVNGNLTVDQSALVDKINVNANGKLNVMDTFVGSVVVKFASALVENAVPEKNAASAGAFTGSVKLEDGTVLINNEGKLVKQPVTP